MDWNAQKTKTLVKRVMCGCWILLMAPCLSACTMWDLQSEQSYRSPPDRYSAVPADTESVEKGLPIEDFYPVAEKKELARERVLLGLSAQQARALGCGIRDRFDRTAAFAYNFKDDQTRVALHLGLDGPSLSDPSRFQVNKVMARFTYNFQKPTPSQKARCLYPSGFQGVAGSVYNEFFVRENYTIWHELRDRGVNLR